MKYFSALVVYESGMDLCLPSIEALSWAMVTETILEEHGDQMPAIKQIIVIERNHHGEASREE
jgi:hypothetical protein